jgi:hypothetical protein
MKRILFLVIWLVPFFAPVVHGDIEIYANGHKYGSLQEYLASKKAVAMPSPATPVALNSQQEDEVRKEAQQLGINVDFNKVKTLQINQKGLSGESMHKLYVLSVEDGVIGALQDFYQTRGQSNVRVNSIISSEELQEAIQQAVATSKDPKFLISEPGRVRIMALTAQDSAQ